MYIYSAESWKHCIIKNKGVLQSHKRTLRDASISYNAPDGNRTHISASGGQRSIHYTTGTSMIDAYKTIFYLRRKQNTITIVI